MGNIQVINEYQPAGFWARALAKVLDIMLVGLVGIVLLPSAAILNTFGVNGPLSFLIVALLIPAWILYFAILSAGGRQTIGCKLMGIRIIRLDGSGMTWPQSLWRTGVDFIFYCLIQFVVGLLAYLPISITRSKRGLHDYLAGTKVDRVDEAKSGRLMMLTVGLIFLNVVAVFLVIRPFFLQAYYSTSNAMSPTVQINNQMIVNKLIYRFREPQRGDVVTFKAPPEATYGREDVIYFKRLIGLPGDTVEVKNGSLYLNGMRMSEPYALGAIVYDMDIVKLQKGQVFVLGDNRNNSNDSHVWGPLDRRRVTGRVMLANWPTLRGL